MASVAIAAAAVPFPLIRLGGPEIAYRSSGGISGTKRGARMERHTGAGSQGAHRRWKARRASGRL